MSEQLSDQEVVRREALRKLREHGIEPFPAAEYPISHTAGKVKGLFQEGAEPVQVTIAGRLMSVRVMGKANVPLLTTPTVFGDVVPDPDVASISQGAEAFLEKPQPIGPAENQMGISTQIESDEILAAAGIRQQRPAADPFQIDNAGGRIAVAGYPDEKIAGLQIAMVKT